MKSIFLDNDFIDVTLLQTRPNEYLTIGKRGRFEPNKYSVYIVKTDKPENHFTYESKERSFRTKKAAKQFVNILSTILDKEIPEYVVNPQDKAIIFQNEPIPRNHLYCVRSGHSDFAEHQRFIAVYVKPF